MSYHARQESLSDSSCICWQIKMGGLDHQVLLVRLKDEVWVCDVGFGGQTPKSPVLLVDNPSEAQNPQGAFLLVRTCNMRRSID